MSDSNFLSKLSYSFWFSSLSAPEFMLFNPSNFSSTFKSIKISMEFFIYSIIVNGFVFLNLSFSSFKLSALQLSIYYINILACKNSPLHYNI